MKIGLTDAPLESLSGELLGVRDYIDALVQFISECNTPMTIAIQGDWGTGKTSMMNVVRSMLEKKNIECIWFNTWQFSQFNMQEDVPAALLMELLNRVVVDKAKIKDFAWGFFKRTAVLATTMVGGKEAGDAAKDAFSINPLDMYAQIRDLREKLKNAIAEKIERSKSDRIVIFVDDLDRMNPGRAVELLEVIKNFMDLPGCIFVLAVDYGVVSRGTRQKYGEGMDEAKGRSFFDKIIQLPFNLPVSQYNITRYLKNVFDVPDDDLDLYKKLAANSVGTNPRSLKRLANVMNLLKLLAAKNYRESLEKPEFQRVLFAVLCLQMAYEPVYSALMSSENVTEFIDKTPEQREEMFAPALAKCPGNRDEVREHFKNFIMTLVDGLPKMENSEDEADIDLLMDLLSMSGLTSSGGLSLLNSNAVKNSFDPVLVAQMPALCEELAIKFREFWDMLELLPSFRMRDTAFLLPITIGYSVEFSIYLKHEGIFPMFYTEQSANTVKKPFFTLLKDTAPKLIKDAKYSGNANNFLVLPAVQWKIPLEDMSEDASKVRAIQIKETLINYTQELLSHLQGIWQENLLQLNKLQEFIGKIAVRIEQLFPAADGWETNFGQKGINILGDWNSIFTIRKNIWRKETRIRLTQDNGGQYIGLTQSWDGKFRENSVTASIYNHWLEYGPMQGEKLTGRMPQLALYAYLPEPVRHWFSGRYFFPDFTYILDDEKQKQALEVIENYAQRFLSVEKEIDWFAARKPE